MNTEIIAAKYEVLAELGRGGMGRVYKVRHRGLNKIYALKVLREHLVEDESLIARFQNEARIMASLHHANIIQVFDIDRDGDRHYFVMEYIEGQTLGDMLKDRAPLPLTEVIEISRQIAQALCYAHQQQPPIIHRDIKPSNILLEAGTGRVVVTDFGIAKLLDAERTRHTLTGFAVGTPSYAAPEQLRSVGDLDGRADIFPLGLVMYEMLAGRPLFEDMTPEEIIGQKLFDPRELQPEFDPSVPTALQQLIRRAIAKDREQRYPSVALFLDDLSKIERGETINQVAMPAKPAYTLYGVLGTILVMLIGYWIWSVFKPSETDPEPVTSEPVVTESTITEPDQPAGYPPVIIHYEPPIASVQLQAGQQQSFSIEAVDPDETTVSYRWFLDDQPVATGETWRYSSDSKTSNEQTVRVEVSDQNQAKAEHSWQVHVSKPAPPPAVIVSPSDTNLTLTVCSAQSFSVSNPETFNDFQWSLDSERQPERGPQFDFEPQEVGVYKLQLQAKVDNEVIEHRWRIHVQPLPISETEVKNWLSRYQHALQNQDGQALLELGDLFSEPELAQLQARQRYQVTLEQWNAIEQQGFVELSFSQIERWYNPQTYSSVVEHASHTLELKRQACQAIVASRK